MAQVLRNLHNAAVLALARIRVVSVFVYFDDNDVTAKVGQHVRPPPRTAVLDFFVARPVDYRELLLDVRYDDRFFRLVVAGNLLVWEKVHETEHTVTSVCLV